MTQTATAIFRIIEPPLSNRFFDFSPISGQSDSLDGFASRSNRHGLMPEHDISTLRAAIVLMASAVASTAR
jgi:hypothetical protein